MHKRSTSQGLPSARLLKLVIRRFLLLEAVETLADQAQRLSVVHVDHDTLEWRAVGARFLYFTLLFVVEQEALLSHLIPRAASQALQTEVTPLLLLLWLITGGPEARLSVGVIILNGEESLQETVLKLLRGGICQLGHVRAGVGHGLLWELGAYLLLLLWRTLPRLAALPPLLSGIVLSLVH